MLRKLEIPVGSRTYRSVNLARVEWLVFSWLWYSLVVFACDSQSSRNPGQAILSTNGFDIGRGWQTVLCYAGAWR